MTDYVEFAKSSVKMEEMLVDNAGDLGDVSSRAKRRATVYGDAVLKKARYTKSSSDGESDVSVCGSSNSSDEEDHGSTLNSPSLNFQTPLSSRSSPRWPSDEKIYHCTYDSCDKSFNRPARLAMHVRSHTNDRPFVCPHKSCTKSFMRNSHLKHHTKSAHSDVRDYLCEWAGCGKRFVTQTRLNKHHAAHQGREKYRCTIENCGQSFRKHATLQAHVAKDHEGRSRYTCEMTDEVGTECGRGFSTSSKLKAHEGRTHGTMRFWCTVCSSQEHEGISNEAEREVSEGVGFSTYSDLQEHIKVDHPPTCLKCGEQFYRPRELKVHYKSQHGATNPEQGKIQLCSEPGCGRGFTRKGNLTAHIRTVHAKEKLFVCSKGMIASLNNISGWEGDDACGSAFTSKGNLAGHVRTVHLGLDHPRKAKKFAKIELKPVSVLTKLTGFGYVEESGRNIVCLISDCEHRFFRDIDLYAHLQNHHGLAISEIPNSLERQDSSVVSLTWDGNPHYRTAEDVEADRAFEAQHVLEENLQISEDSAMTDQPFLIGGDSTYVDPGIDDWARDQMETQRSVNGENEDEVMIDPVLRS